MAHLENNYILWLNLGCGPAKSFEISIDSDQKVFVYDAEIQVKYDRNALAVYEYPGQDNVNVLINDTVIAFTGTRKFKISFSKSTTK